jgi:hypothetical protein
MNLDKLLLAKYLFQNGQDFLRRDEPYSYGLAVSLFQDAVECLLYAIAIDLEALSPNDKRNIRFMDYWDKIKDAHKNLTKLEVPLKPQMEHLNLDRVDFKHRASLPALLTARDHFLNTEEFLRRTMEAFFNIKFDDLSMADLLSNNEVREIIKDGEKYFAQKDYTKCIGECSKASVSILGSFKWAFWGGRSTNSPNISTRNKSIDGHIKKFFEYFNEVRYKDLDFTVIAALQIKIADYRRFLSLAPQVSRTVSGVWQTNYRSTEYSPEDADFCLKYVTNFAWLVQNRI